MRQVLVASNMLREKVDDVIVDGDVDRSLLSTVRQPSVCTVPQ